MTTTEPEERKRGGCLTAWLLFVLLVNLLMFLAYFTVWFTSNPDRIYRQTGIPWIFFFGFALLSALNMVGVVGMWRWKLWGFYLIAVAAGVALILNLIVGVPFYLALLGVISPLVLWLLLRSKMRYLT